MLTDGNIFAFQTTVVAYEQGEEWLNQLLAYVQGNIDFLTQYIDQYLPKVKYLLPQDYYLVFLDFGRWKCFWRRRKRFYANHHSFSQICY